MKFLIRDDDICFFTQPEELENAWGWLWEIDGKINFAVIPFVGIFDKRFGKGLYPIGENRRLLDYLKKKVKDGRAEILLHGYSHLSIGRKFEFESSDEEDLSQKIKEGKEYLETLFESKVRVFVPPNNGLGRAGLTAVSRNGMSVLSSISFSPFKRRANIMNLFFLLKRKIFSYRYRMILDGKFVYPFIVHFPSHTQLDCIPLLPSTSLKKLITISQMIKNYSGIFCLSTHYWEIVNTTREVIQKLVQFLLTNRENEISTASEAFGERDDLCSSKHM